MREWRAFLEEEDGMGVVEVILIIVILISLAAIFKTQITSLVNKSSKKSRHRQIKFDQRKRKGRSYAAKFLH